MASLKYLFKHFLKRHKRVFPLLGAVIILVTFVVKEQLSEKWRDTAARINHAQDTYDNRVLTHEIDKRLDDLDSTLARIENGKGKTLSPRILNLMSRNKRTADEITNSLNDIESLLKVIDDEESAKPLLEAKLKKYRKEINGAQSEYEAIEEIDNAALTDHVGPDKWKYDMEDEGPLDHYLDDQEDDTFGERVLGFTASLSHLSYDADLLNKRILSITEELRDKNEKRTTYASYVTLGLFLSGWGVGVIGKVDDEFEN